MFHIGVDLGQRNDHTAVVIIEKKDIIRHYRQEPSEFWVRHAERIPLGTPFHLAIGRVRQIVSHPELVGHCAVAVDATSLGGPIVEMMRAEKLGCELTAVTITGGDRQHSYSAMGGTAFTVPKQDIIAGVQVLLERDQLKIASGLKEKSALIKELMDVQMTTGPSGRIRYGAEGTNQHDDMVIALSLACWHANRKTVGWVSKPLPFQP